MFLMIHHQQKTNHNVPNREQDEYHYTEITSLCLVNWRMEVPPDREIANSVSEAHAS